MSIGYFKVVSCDNYIHHYYHTKKSFKPSHYNSGFSLIELFITLSIISITLSSASPYFGQIVNTIKIKNTSRNIQSALRLARSTALSVQSSTVICPLSQLEKEKCNNNKGFNNNWSYGWLIYTDFNDNKKFDNGDSLVKSNKLEGNVTIVFNQQGTLRFFSDGSARSAGFYVCKESTNENRHIKLLYTGRSRTTKIDNEKQQSICLSSANKK